ncbi:FecR family protein [Mariniphaga sediminis]|uniref:FecR family protein n=1 Tax=Mariniphaga sediminis TaxID=1628158 RepID=A0A399D0D3_9BACT|nr:FecR family protein [Mariniphaga sediminis]RIH64873.1 FecR family protein [Mariniphaga sediminis]
MPKTVTIIDFEIIWNQIHYTISDEEQAFLNQWLEESADHRKFYESVKRFYADGSSFKNEKKDIDRGWKDFGRKTKLRRNKYSRLLSYASFTLLGVVLATAIYFILPRFEKQSVVEEVDIPIKPGSSKATLILDNGEVYGLSENSEEVFSEGGAQIKNTGDKLEYIAVTPEEGEVRFHTLEVPRGGEYFLVLSDGTKVWLNSETTLRYPIHFEKEERKVELTGEAYFEVTENKDAPFRVTSGEQIVKVLGTKFNISSFPEDAFALTTLVEGKVEVTLDKSPEMKQLLLPRDQCRFEKEEGTFSKKKVDPYQFIAWKEGRFVFENESLSDIMKTLSKWYDVDIFFNSEKASGYRFTGNLRRYDNFREILKKIEKTNEVEFIIKDRQIIVK